MQQGEQHEQDARQENRGAGQHDAKDGEHRAGHQEQGPPAAPRGAREPHHRAGAGSCIRLVSRVSRSMPAPSFCGRHQILPRNVVVPRLQDNRPTMTRQDPGIAGLRANGLPQMMMQRSAAALRVLRSVQIRLTKPPGHAADARRPWAHLIAAKEHVRDKSADA